MFKTPLCKFIVLFPKCRLHGIISLIPVKMWTHLSHWVVAPVRFYYKREKKNKNKPGSAIVVLYYFLCMQVFILILWNDLCFDDISMTCFVYVCILKGNGATLFYFTRKRKIERLVIVDLCLNFCVLFVDFYTSLVHVNTENKSIYSDFFLRYYSGLHFEKKKFLVCFHDKLIV